MSQTRHPVSRRASAALLSRWIPTLGGIADGKTAFFRVWAPVADKVELVLAEEKLGQDVRAEVHPMARAEDGTFSVRVPGLAPGDRYWYRLNGARLVPDPASRFQPRGVHGPSQLIDPSRFRWSDHDWPGLRDERLVVYELHVGSFTREGTFAGVAARLPELASLGITAVELMPVAECAGRWNWGYDAVDLFAPSHRYGTPDDLRRLVDAAHQQGIGVILDVVYNHLGPDGAYLSAFSPYYFSDRHQSPWGDGVNLDGPLSERVRAFFIENALHWIHEYHVDGFRLDATHALQDDSSNHFLAELSARIRDEAGDRSIVLIAEDERNLDLLVRAQTESGFGLTGVWSDDFHHHARRLLAGDREGYFESFTGTTRDLATTVRRGWFFAGQESLLGRTPRGTDPGDIPLHRFVFCLQNHDQVGNRAFGERLNHQVDLAAYRAASAVLLLAPETPLLFMGQEWAASSPFLYFTDHEPDLGRQVTEGRRAEFSAFSAFRDPRMRQRIPDPQEEETFARSRLHWSERGAMPHLGVWRLYQALLHLRRSDPALADGLRSPSASAVAAAVPANEVGLDARALDEDTIVLKRWAAGCQLVLVSRLAGRGTTRVPPEVLDPTTHWETVLTTEDRAFAENGRVPARSAEPGGVAITFGGPASILLRPGG